MNNGNIVEESAQFTVSLADDKKTILLNWGDVAGLSGRISGTS